MTRYAEIKSFVSATVLVYIIINLATWFSTSKAYYCPVFVLTLMLLVTSHTFCPMANFVVLRECTNWCRQTAC